MTQNATIRGNGATLRDIAERAGVNRSTVSRILSGTTHFPVSDECRRRVMAVAEELRYHPKLSARSLAAGKSFNVNLLLGSIWKDLTLPSNAMLIDATSRELKKNGYNLVLTPITVGDIDAMTREVRQTLGSCSVDGTIIGAGLLNQDLREEFNSNRVPAVLLDIHIREENFGCFPFIHHLAYDEYPGQEALLEHLIKLGHEKIAYITEGPAPDIMSAFTKAAEKHHFDFSEADVFWFLDWRKESISSIDRQMFFYEKTAEQWNELKRYSALVCTDTVGVMGIVRFLKKQGLEVGKDISVVGYGNCERVGAGITTVDKSWTETGRMAVKMLLHAITHPDDPVQHVKMPTRLLIGETTGRVGGEGKGVRG